MWASVSNSGCVIHPATPVGARRGVRRAVDIPCELVRSGNDRVHRYRATNLSHDGMWLHTPNPARAGEVVVVCFRPGDGWNHRELHVFGEVVRVTSVRHRPGELPPDVGMGLELLDLTAEQQRQLRGWLISRRQPLPRRRRPLPRRPAPTIVAAPPLTATPTSAMPTLATATPERALRRAQQITCWR